MLYYRVRGEGKPTIIFDSGLGDTSEVWDRVEPQVTLFSRTLVYDRANLGASDPAPHPRTSKVMVKDLLGLLSREIIEGPYLLVGHSFGGLNMMLFAALCPEKVAGMVLVDSAHPNQMIPMFALLPQSLSEEYKAGIEHSDENLTFAERLQSEDDVKSAPVIPDIPLVVISRALKRPPSEKWPTEALDTLWHEQQQDLAHLTTHSKLIIADRSGHYVQRDQPRVVIDAIRNMVEEYRRQ